MTEYEAFKAAREMAHADTMRTLERIAAAEHADPASDDLTVPLAIELADAQATISRLTAENERLKATLDAGPPNRTDAIASAAGLALEALRAERDGLMKALTRLLNEVDGLWAIGEPGIRRAVGNTNFACVQERMREAHAALRAPVPDAVR